MTKNKAFRKAYIQTILLLLLCILMAGCTGEGNPATPTSLPPLATPTLTSVPPAPTPTVNLADARQRFDAGGELTYYEVVALRKEIVGDSDEIDKIKDAQKRYQAQDEYQVRDDAFGMQLEQCMLANTVGWIEGWTAEHDEQYKDIPDKNRVYVDLFDPYADYPQDYSNYDFMLMVDFSDSQVAELKYGERIGLTGKLALVSREIAVKDAHYTVLADVPVVPTPAPAEANDLLVTLERTGCFGICPSYIITIDATGAVTFEGRHYTLVKGKAQGMIDSTKLVELASEIKRARFFDLRDNYDLSVTDLPTDYLTITMGGKSKHIRAYGGGPIRLQLLTARIDQIVNSAQWIGHDAKE